MIEQCEFFWCFHYFLGGFFSRFLVWFRNFLPFLGKKDLETFPTIHQLSHTFSAEFGKLGKVSRAHRIAQAHHSAHILGGFCIHNAHRQHKHAQNRHHTSHTMPPGFLMLTITKFITLLLLLCTNACMLLVCVLHIIKLNHHIHHQSNQSLLEKREHPNHHWWDRSPPSQSRC